jgi:hypothetical protein
VVADLADGMQHRDSRKFDCRNAFQHSIDHINGIDDRRCRDRETSGWPAIAPQSNVDAAG